MADFRYKQGVEIIKGFYTGHQGYLEDIIEYADRTKYKVRLNPDKIVEVGSDQIKALENY